MADKKQGNPASIIIFLLLIAGAVGLYFYAQQKNGLTSQEEHPPAEMAAEDANPEESENIVEIDTAAAIKDRILGDPNAPIKISEHSSFTCSHCGSFHRDTFDAFKARLIDTGKAYLVFSDFPLNAPALHASMLARCLPEDQYFDFIEDLFKNQESWAYETNYLDLLQTKTAEYGLEPEGFKACLDNKAIQEGILNRMRAAQAQWQISSTPSFVVNNKTVISGAKSIDEFETAIGEALAPKEKTEEKENTE